MPRTGSRTLRARSSPREIYTPRTLPIVTLGEPTISLTGTLLNRTDIRRLPIASLPDLADEIKSGRRIEAHTRAGVMQEARPRSGRGSERF